MVLLIDLPPGILSTLSLLLVHCSLFPAWAADGFVCLTGNSLIYRCVGFWNLTSFAPC